MPIPRQPGHPRRGPLDWIEWAGNRLPEPTLLFALLALAVIVLSALGAALGWQVQPVEPVLQLDPAAPGLPPELVLVPQGAPLEPRSLLTVEGIYWMLSSMLRNFAEQPALPLIFVAMIGIGAAERLGLFAALMRWLAPMTPMHLLTPAVVFIGANSAITAGASYIILPPLAAALYLAVGRHPVAGLAAAFAGVAGGFGAGFFPTGTDAVLTGFAQDAARVIDPGYTVTILHNYWFTMASSVVVMLGGWWVTDRIIEPRLNRLHAAERQGDDPDTLRKMALSPRERQGLFAALLTAAAILAVFLAMVLLPGAPLHGDGQPRLANDRVLAQQAVQVLPAGGPVAADAVVLADDPLTVVAQGAPRLTESPGPRWSQAIVPFILIIFLVPGLVYGVITRQLRNQIDLSEALMQGVRDVVPVLVILFFLAQFIAFMAYSGLDRMLAYSGGSLLFGADLPIPLLIVAFVLVVVFGDFVMPGMLSKFGVMAPIFIPMFMIVGMSPELTTAAYRIGDSVVNIITPLNSYLLIVLAVLQKYRPRAGVGTLIALMLPYSLVLGLFWTALLVGWYFTGLPLGPGAPLLLAPGP